MFTKIIHQLRASKTGIISVVCSSTWVRRGSPCTNIFPAMLPTPTPPNKCTPSSQGGIKYVARTRYCNIIFGGRWESARSGLERTFGACDTL